MKLLKNFLLNNNFNYNVIMLKRLPLSKSTVVFVS